MSTEMVAVESTALASVVIPKGITFTPRGATIESWVTDEDKWLAFSALRQFDSAAAWNMIDLLVSLGKQPSDVNDELAEKLGRGTGTLRNMIWVGRAIPLELRRTEELTVAHHVAVAPLTYEEQEFWLGKAVQDELSVAALREGIKIAQVEAEAEAYREKNRNSPENEGTTDEGAEKFSAPLGGSAPTRAAKAKKGTVTTTADPEPSSDSATAEEGEAPAVEGLLPAPPPLNWIRRADFQVPVRGRMKARTVEIVPTDEGFNVLFDGTIFATKTTEAKARAVAEAHYQTLFSPAKNAKRVGKADKTDPESTPADEEGSDG